MNSTDSLQKLIDGNKRYAEARNSTSTAQITASDRDKLTSGQSPYAAVVSCADSRVCPEQIFDATIGELFVTRVAGNIANPDLIASLEYAIAHLKTPLILVLGHSACGAVTAALDRKQNGSNLGSEHLNGLAAKINASLSDESSLDAAISTNAASTAKQLAFESLIIEKAVSEGHLKICSGVYDLASGCVTLHD